MNPNYNLEIYPKLCAVCTNLSVYGRGYLDVENCTDIIVAK